MRKTAVIWRPAHLTEAEALKIISEAAPGVRVTHGRRDFLITDGSRQAVRAAADALLPDNR